MATLATVIDEIQNDLATISGIRAAPHEPPDQMSAFPFIVCYPVSGEWNSDIPGSKKGLHNIVVELHIARKALPRDVAAALVYCDSIPNMLLKAVSPTGDLFNNSISTFERITYRFGNLGWGDTATVGFRFEILNVKLQSLIT